MDRYFEIIGILGAAIFIFLLIASVSMKKDRVKRNIIGILISIFILVSGCVIQLPDNNSTRESNPNGNNQERVEDNQGITAGKLKIHFIDVGQADSILVQNEGGAMLVDGGNNGDAVLVIDYIKNQGIEKLDYVIGTHPHEDHIGGLDRVIETFDIGKVFMPKVSSSTKTYRDVLNAIQVKGLKITAPKPGSGFKMGETFVEILAPNSDNYDEVNNYSIVLKLKHGNTSFILTGDAEDISEHEIIEKGFDISADLLKLGHHGSSSSTSEEFLERVNPDYAVISVGTENDYGHPMKVTMDRLKEKGISVYRTDENGTIVVVSDGEKIGISSEPGSYSAGKPKN